MESKFNAYKRVGYFRERMAKFLGVDFTGTIYASPGVIKHIKKRHGKHLKRRVYNNIIEVMRDILNSPDYIGVYKEVEGGISVELIKEVDGNILVGIEIDEENEYIYVSTMYPITDAKINSKLYSGRLKNWSKSY